jgi:quercetin dioxygenase-like cupin family protein
MTENVVVRSPGEGRTVLVGESEYITYVARSAETAQAYFAFELSVTTPGYGPPLHTHDYRELFYVLEGRYELTIERDGELETIEGLPGTAVHVPPNVPHTFTSAGETGGRLFFVHTPAGLEEFFEEFGVPVDRVGDVPEGLEPPDPAKMGPALERHGIHIVGAPQAA